MKTSSVSIATQSSPVTTSPAAETMRHFNLSRYYIVRLLNETIAGCEGQDIRIAMASVVTRPDSSPDTYGGNA